MALRSDRYLLCADHYLAHICHFFTGSILVDACLGAYRRHGANGFTTVPVYASNAANSPFNDYPHNQPNLSVMLAHVLDNRDRFIAVFGTGRVRKLVSALTGYHLHKDRRLVDPRARALLGKAGLASAWWGERHRRRHPG